MTLGENMQTEGNYSGKYYFLFILFQQICFPKSTTLLEFTLPWVNSQQMLFIVLLPLPKNRDDSGSIWDKKKINRLLYLLEKNPHINN